MAAFFLLRFVLAIRFCFRHPAPDWYGLHRFFFFFFFIFGYLDMVNHATMYIIIIIIII